MHDTGSSATRKWNDAVRYMSHPQDGRQVSIHYKIGKEKNQVVSMVPENMVANHVKAGGHNSHSIGIELFRRQNELPFYSEHQYETVAQLVYDIMIRYSLPYTSVRGHGEVQPETRKDPHMFEWERLEDTLTALDACANQYTNIWMM